MFCNLRSSSISWSISTIPVLNFPLFHTFPQAGQPTQNKWIIKPGWMGFAHDLQAWQMETMQKSVFSPVLQLLNQTQYWKRERYLKLQWRNTDMQNSLHKSSESSPQCYHWRHTKISF
jgi:hypothetical protein